MFFICNCLSRMSLKFSKFNQFCNNVIPEQKIKYAVRSSAQVFILFLLSG